MTDSKHPIRVIIADDSALLREGIAGLITRRGFEVIGHASSATELIAAVQGAVSEGTSPDLVITDVRMPPNMKDDGLQAAVQLRADYPALHILVISQYVAPTYARELFAQRTPTAPARSRQAQTGGTGYLLKDRVSNIAEFLTALETVAHGGVSIDPEVASALMSTGNSGLAELTSREMEVLELMAQGLSNKQIAGELFLSGAAVAKHVSNIFFKLRLAPDEENRRVRAILEYLSATGNSF